MRIGEAGWWQPWSGFGQPQRCLCAMQQVPAGLHATSPLAAHLVLLVPDAHVGKDVAVVGALQLLPVLLHQLRQQALQVLLRAKRGEGGQHWWAWRTQRGWLQLCNVSVA